MLEFFVAVAMPLATLIAGIVSVFELANWLKARRARKGARR